MILTEFQSWTDHILALASDASFLTELAQIKARALLKEISAETAEQPKWNYLISRVLRNLTATIFEIENLSRDGKYSRESLGESTRQFALAWESLAKLSDGSARSSALINAAVSYELAGYQANTACLARQVGKTFLQVAQPDISDLTSAFLQRFFLQVVNLSARTKKEPVVDRLTDFRLWTTAGLGLAGEGFAEASRFFLSGENAALEAAHGFLADSERVFSRVGAVSEANIVRSIRSLLGVMRENSTWVITGDTAKDNPRWTRYLRLLARGLGSKVFESPSVSELWPSQVQALRSGLLDPTLSKIFKMPTSAGKTRVAELAIVYTLVTQPGSKCVYIAPFRALVSELEQTFLNLLGDLGFQVSSVTGAYESDDFEQIIVEDADVLVITPEKLDLLQRARPEFLNQVRLFIMDEAQIADDRRRGVKFEILLTRLKRKLLNTRFLFLSAVIPQQTLEDFAKWFNALPTRDIVTSEWRPSIRRVAKFVWQGSTGILRYAKSEDNPLLEEFVPGVIKQHVYPIKDLRKGRTKNKVFPDFTSNQTAAELALKFAELGPVLVFCAQTTFAKAVAKALEIRLGYAQSSSEPISPEFVENVSRRSAVTSKEWLGDSHIVTRLLRRGIAIHYGDLPEAVRKSIETDFREKNLRVLISTTTLAQGVNLPIRTVVVHSCRRYGDEGWERIPARDYWNIAGRAGRAGHETDGTVIHIVTDIQSEGDYQYYLSHRDDVEPVYSRLFRLLLGLTQDRLTEASLQERLDPEILAILVEEGDSMLSSDTIQSILDETLTKVHADRLGLNLIPLNRVFLDTSQNINSRVPDPALRKVYSSTGLSTVSCEAIRTYVQDNNETEDLLRNADSTQVGRLGSFFLAACLPLSEMQMGPSFAGNYNELLQRWLSGVKIGALVSEFGAQASSPEHFAKFIESFFGFRLPWGITAVIKIATHVLDLKEHDISIYARFFSSMTKYGVPNPIATWAMSVGIPFREAGIKLSAMYLGEASKIDYKGFLEWISQISSEQLRDDFAFRSPILEDVSAAISRSSINPYLKNHSSVLEILPKETYVRGVSYENRANVALASNAGQSIDLRRDYDNDFDRNAILVLARGEELGYLDRHLAQLAAPDIDCGTKLTGEIVRIEKNGIPKVLIRLRQANIEHRGEEAHVRADTRFGS